MAEQAAAAHGLGVRVLDENELAKEGFGGILAVGMGSAHPPRLVRLEYTHPDADRTVVFAGKGITFDSGGLSLKPPKAMETMKADMSGAAAVLAAVRAIAELGPAVNVIGYLPLAENMPGGGAQRPSDVISIYGGKTVEVLNTDAEGRLVLADALARSAVDGPGLLVDVATLTGAQTVALGNRTAGVMASDDSLAAEIADAARTVVFAVKGITFDSGGLSLKPPKAMETMKADMSGAAAVLAAVRAVAELGPAVNVVGYLPLAENMPGGGAQRPSDVITIYGGKTVEVLNTDAEGRLVLADALARSGADAPSLLIDVATLTGAQTVALGNRTAGVMASDDSLAAGIAAAARRAGEAMWPMPLPEDLRKGLDSTVADIANVSGDRSGGMLVAGLFLREFVPAAVPWAHLDIAGPAYNDGGAYGYVSKGGTGAAVRTLVQIAVDVAEGKLADLGSSPDGGK